jgi:glutaminyl-peptide cyclotransferase
MKNYIYILLLAILITACGEEKKEVKKEDAVVEKKVEVPSFNEDSAYAFVAKQVSFGPRVPGTKAHAKCAEWLQAELKKFGGSVYVQSGEVTTFDGKKFQLKNIIASFNAKAAKRILLAAHWDTRPFADQDDENKNNAIDGANDGGSGVGVLLEIARQMQMKNTDVGVDIILFDIEDYGQPEISAYKQMQDSYCLGSQYWAKNPPIPNYKPMFGILLDMVGGENAVFMQEEISRVYAPQVLEKVWAAAAQAGYSSYFSYQASPAIIDDHYYVNTLANITMIDIIHRDETSASGFWKHWHTNEDKLDKIDKKSLKAVGQAVMQTIYTSN